MASWRPEAAKALDPDEMPYPGEMPYPEKAPGARVS
jgi:hypothetical protein